ncbi:hypothetical protein [Streptomyces cinnamoneus]|uniref:hypothetical protein n=1 Tax=Streptomyces cinnamoneus TaxID=53446 RepID=UPI0027E47CBA|nr:hypothetical protein [Streptomyces cinnamoneus]
MAEANISPAPPMAAPGYGKRTAPGQAPRTREAFAHLPAREAYIASHLDRLPEGAAMDVKTLAKELPYGQQALGTALNALSQAGHLRRVRERVSKDRTQWVFRTYFSRTARDDAWWNRFLTGDVTPEQEAAASPPARSEAYDALAALGRADARLALSAADCAELEPLAAKWLSRGTSRAELIRTLTAGLPPDVHSPAALTRTRLTVKMPPERVMPMGSRLMECTSCRTPGRPEALSGGLCRACHGDHEATSRPPSVDVRDRAAAVRAASRAGRDKFLKGRKR